MGDLLRGSGRQRPISLGAEGTLRPGKFGWWYSQRLGRAGLGHFGPKSIPHPTNRSQLNVGPPRPRGSLRTQHRSRIRQFDADEIVAFARAFDQPVTWFFLPPPPWASPGIPTKLRTPDAERFGTPLALLADLVFGQDHQIAFIVLRFQAFLDQLGPNPLSDAQQRAVSMVQDRKEQLLRHALGDLQEWQTQLRNLANRLEDLEQRTARRVDQDDAG